MTNVNILGIYQIMIRFYRSYSFDVYSTLDNESLKPKEMMLTFHFDNLTKVNVNRLHKQLSKHVISSENYFISLEESKIIVVIEFAQNKLYLFDSEMEFSLN